MFNMRHVQVVTLPCKIDAGGSELRLRHPLSSGLVPDNIEGGRQMYRRRSQACSQVGLQAVLLTSLWGAFD